MKTADYIAVAALAIVIIGVCSWCNWWPEHQMRERWRKELKRQKDEYGI